MHFNVGLLISFLFSLSLVGIADAAGFHTFKDTQGREMKAKITLVRGDDIYIERRDGLETKVPRSIFCKADQDYITEWERMAFLKSDFLEVNFTTTESDKRKSSSGGIERENYNVHYNILITNTAHEDLTDIKVEYLFLKFEDFLSATKRSEGKLLRFKGSSKIKKIPAREEVSVSTEEIPMLESDLESGYVWTNGAKKSSKDKLKGIWVKIYSGDTLVHEYSRPATMINNEKWD
jgi:hypothetical protein